MTMDEKAYRFGQRIGRVVGLVMCKVLPISVIEWMVKRWWPEELEAKLNARDH